MLQPFARAFGGLTIREIGLDASTWTQWLDVCDAVLPLLGAPEGHGYSVDAFIDSMVWGGMNVVEPPYIVCIRGTEVLPATIFDYLVVVRDALVEARAEFRASQGHDVDVAIVFCDWIGPSHQSDEPTIHTRWYRDHVPHPGPYHEIKIILDVVPDGRCVPREARHDALRSSPVAPA